MHSSQYAEYVGNTQYTHYVSGGSDCGKNIKFDNSRHWPAHGAPVRHGIPGLVQGLHSLWHYHHDVYVFHTHFLNGCTHTYASQPRGWLLLNRPVGVDAQTGIKPGVGGCNAPADSDCLRQVLLLGTPALWWGGVLALLYAAVMWVGARDWRFGVAVVGAASTWLPWFLYDGRPIFSFYSVITLPFLVLAITLALGKILGTLARAVDAAHRRRRDRRVVRRPRAAELRLVLADLHRRPAHPRRVAPAHLVRPLDLTARGAQSASWRPRNSRAASATPVQPESITSEWPRPSISTISVASACLRCFL